MKGFGVGFAGMETFETEYSRRFGRDWGECCGREGGRLHLPLFSLSLTPLWLRGTCVEPLMSYPVIFPILLYGF